MKAPNLTNDEYSMIFSNHFGIGFTPKGGGTVPANDYPNILTCACQVAFAFIFAMLGCIMPFPVSVLCWLAVALMLISRVVTLSVFFAAVFCGRYTKDFYRSSIMYWGWWPMNLAFWSFAATVLGALMGSWLWSECLAPYYELRGLQKYKDINPEHVPGERIQDAGLVDFTNFVEMDRAKGGCFMNRGNTYCIAPIVNGGQVKYGLSGVPESGSYDYFAVGINCCSCPNRDFQCGEWQNPMASSGIRSLDYKSRPYYSLALDDWQASYGKTSKHPMFFDWVQGAEWKWKGMWNRALQAGWMAAAAALSIGLCVGFLLDKLLQFLWQNDYLASRVSFAPAPGCEVITELLLPKMYYRYLQEQTEIAAMPVATEIRAQQGASSDEENAKQFGQGYGATNAMNGMLGSVMAPPGAASTMPQGMGSYSMY